jgi:cell division protein FtsL
MSRFVYFFGTLVAIFLALGMFQAKTGARESALEIKRLKKEIEALDREIVVLEKEHDVLSRSDRIARLAVEELGMGPARSHQMLQLKTAKNYIGPLVEYEELK